MKYFLLTLFFMFSITLHAKEPQKVTIGLGPYIQSQPYKGVKNIVVPSPVIFFDNSIFYIRWSRAGIYFLGEKQEDYAWGFSLTAQPRPFGYKPSDSTTLEGMQERETTFEGGIAFSASYKKKSTLEMMLLTDILNKHDAWLFKTEITHQYDLGKFTFYPSIILMYQSQKFLDYYYGVRTQEATPQRPAYTPTGGFEVGAQTYISYPLTKKLSTLINLRIDLLPKTAQDSPIVSENTIYSGLFSLIYTFSY